MQEHRGKQKGKHQNTKGTTNENQSCENDQSKVYESDVHNCTAGGHPG